MTRCSPTRFLRLCSQLDERKQEAIRDMNFGGLLSITCKEVRHNICLWLIERFDVGLRKIQLSSTHHLEVTPNVVNEIFGLPMHGRILQVSSNPSEHPFGRIRDCEDRLRVLPIGEEFRRAFIWYACATILAPTSRVDGCRNLWHTLHGDEFRNDINWAQFVVDELVSGIRHFQQSQTAWVHGSLVFLQVSIFFISLYT